MTRRSYQQYCGLAAALDVVGERWALLIVRDLVPGPRRFTDLLAGLPGIATDVLAERLRSLEAAGAVAHRTLDPPAPAKVYELTSRGRALGRIAGALAEWGAPLLPPPATASHRMNPRWALQSMVQPYRGGLPDGDYHWVIDDTDLTIHITGDTASVRYGPAADPLVHIRCTAPQFFRLVAGEASAARSTDVAITGRRGLVNQLFRAMPLPTGRRPSIE